MPDGVAKTDGKHCFGPFWPPPDPHPRILASLVFQKSIDSFGMSKVSIPLFGQECAFRSFMAESSLYPTSLSLLCSSCKHFPGS